MYYKVCTFIYYVYTTHSLTSVSTDTRYRFYTMITQVSGMWILSLTC